MSNGNGIFLLRKLLECSERKRIGMVGGKGSRRFVEKRQLNGKSDF